MPDGNEDMVSLSRSSWSPLGSALTPQARRTGGKAAVFRTLIGKLMKIQQIGPYLHGPPSKALQLILYLWFWIIFLKEVPQII